MSRERRRVLTLVVRGPLERGDLPGLFERACAELRATGAELVLCDARDVAADAVAIEALTRLQLAAGRLGCEVRLRDASPELRELVAFVGLEQVVGRRDAGAPVLASDSAASREVAVAARTAGTPARCRGRT